MIYFDNAATTRPSARVIEAITNVMRENYANPASASAFGLMSENIITSAKKDISKILNISPEEIYFTSGGTEANNWAIFSGVKLRERRGRHIITTKMEHPSVLQPIKYLEDSGFSVAYVSPDKNGVIDTEELKKALRPDTVLVAIQLVNNETGAIQPIEEAVKIVKSFNENIVFHCDAVQAFCKIPVDIKKLKVDTLSLSGHKIHGPKGIGALFIRKDLKLEPFILGGGQQTGLRSGTENTEGAIGFKTAVNEINITENFKKVLEIKTFLADGILSSLENTHINGDDINSSSPYILNIGFSGIRAEVLLHSLEAAGIIVSAGSACSSHKNTLSPTLSAMGVNPEYIKGAIRFSFSENSKLNEAKECLNALYNIVPKLRKFNK